MFELYRVVAAGVVLLRRLAAAAKLLPAVATTAGQFPRAGPGTPAVMQESLSS